MSNLQPTSPGSQPPSQFDPLEFYNLAKTLAQIQTECCFRTAIGRSYYAMYLFASERKQVVSKKSLNPRQQHIGEHQYLTMILDMIPGQRNIASQLRKLKRLRTVADYEMLPANTSYQNWVNNWNNAEILVGHILPGLTQL